MVRHRQKRLPDRVRDVIHGRHCSICTEQASASWTRRSMLFHDRLQPKEMGADEIEEYVTCPVVERTVAAPTQNRALGGLLFLYQNGLKTDFDRVG